MPKNIVFCADGTWNSPNADDNKDQIPDPTNVYKLFISLEGSLAVDSIRSADEQEKSLEVAGTTQQVAKYIHGVGDSRNAIHKLMGGAFGAGVISRVQAATPATHHHRPYRVIAQCTDYITRIRSGLGVAVPYPAAAFCPCPAATTAPNNSIIRPISASECAADTEQRSRHSLLGVPGGSAMLT